MADPAATLADRAEHTRFRASGTVEEVRGYAVMGVPFRSGHVLALRRLPSSSFGPAYTTVWHRAPSGDWTIYTNVDPELSCPRYFGSGVARVRQCAIDVEWTGASQLRVTVPEASLSWESRVTGTPLTGLMNALARLMPPPFWRSGPVLAAMGMMSSVMLGVGRVQLRGRVPNGQWFQLQPRVIFRLDESTASMAGEQFGELGPLPEQEFLADFPVTQRGLLAFGAMLAERLDPTRHRVPQSASHDVGPGRV